jgi:hypothetical protein
VSSVPRPRLRIRRLLLALDSTCTDDECLTIAVELAARLEVDLAGLFVEDINVLRSASLPFVRQVSPLTASPHPFDLADTERELKGFAARLERHLSSAADQRRVKWSFQVVRGIASREVAQAALESDLVAIAETAPRSLAYSSTSRTVREAVREAGRTVLLLRPGVKVEGPIVLIYDGSPASDEAMDVALKLLVGIDAALEVFLVRESAERAAKLTQLLRERAAGHGTPIRIHRFSTGDFSLVRRALFGMNAGFLIIPASPDTGLTARNIDDITQGLPCPVLFLP